MLKKFTKLMVVAAMLALPLLLPRLAFADAKSSVCEGIGITGSSTGCDTSGSPTTVNNIIHTVISILSYLIGAVSIIMIIIGGFKYVTSAGDTNKISSAKNTITYALIGIVLTVLAQVIVRFAVAHVSSPYVSPGANAPSVDNCGVQINGKC